jgi:subtilisin family serine protease
VDIISHSIGFDNLASPNGNNYWAKVADSVKSRGTLLVTAAGNEGQRYNQSTWSDKDKDNFLEFSGKTENLRIASGPGGYVSLRWDDSFGKSNHDYDLRVLDESGNEVGRSENFQSGSQDPYEEIFFPNGFSGVGTVQVAHDPGSPTKSNQKLWLYVGGNSAMDAAYQTKAMTLTLPADSKTAVSVGAVKYSNKQLEASSSRGPTADNRVKPDLTAPDGVSAASWDGPFFGTSAATPHAAGAAALILSHNPSMSVSALKAALLKATATSGGSKSNDKGFGLIDLSKAN